MKGRKINPKRVLAIDPTSHGFGYIVIESPTTPIDWGAKRIKPQNEAETLGKVSKLIKHYQPQIIVLEDYRGSRRYKRVRDLLDAIRRLATTENLKTRCFPVSRVKKVFGAFQANTKEEIAHAIAQQLPELAPRLPRHRKPWMSEDYRMTIFDAAALALTYFYSLPVLRSEVPKKVSANP